MWYLAQFTNSDRVLKIGKLCNSQTSRTICGDHTTYCNATDWSSKSVSYAILKSQEQFVRITQQHVMQLIGPQNR